MFNALREEQGRRLLTNVKAVAAGCMKAAWPGPTLLVTPDNVWYGGVTEADVPELVEHHHSEGEGATRLRADALAAGMRSSPMPGIPPNQPSVAPAAAQQIQDKHA